MTPPREPIPYPPTREIVLPRRAARPSGYLPPVPPPAAARPGFLESALREDYPDPRSRNPLHVYGPWIFVGGGLVFVIVLVVLVVSWIS